MSRSLPQKSFGKNDISIFLFTFVSELFYAIMAENIGYPVGILTL